MGRHSAPQQDWRVHVPTVVAALLAGTFGALVGTILRAVVPWL